MSTARFTLTFILVFALLAPGASQSLAQPAASPTAATSSTSSGAILIVENAGQWPTAARFQVWNSPLGPGTTWLAEDAIWLVVAGSKSQVAGGKWQVAGSEASADPLADLQPANVPPATLHALKLTFPGSNPNVRIEPFEPADTTVSYFLGNDPEQWRADVPVWGGVRYVDLYPGVDLVLGERDTAWRLEAANGAAVEQVRVHIEGAEIVALDGAALQLAAAGGISSLALPTAPFSYRAMGVSSLGSPLTLVLSSESRPSQAHQPVDNPGALLYSTFLGGSGLYSDGVSGIAVDDIGNAYVAGITNSTDFPTTPGAFDPSFNSGLYDAFVAKLDPSGSVLVYATFLGGSDWDSASDIATDAMGNTYVIGRTASTDFATTPGAFDTSFNGGSVDVFATKLNPAGSALVYSSYLGSSGDDYDGAIAIDGLNNAYLLGDTFSSSFPTTQGAFDTSHNGSLDVFVAKLNPAGSQLIYSTFLGGSSGDEGRDVAVDVTGGTYVTGSTHSSGFPTTSGAFDTTFNGGPYGAGDAFVAKLNSAGSTLDYATFLGGSSGNDGGGAIAIDAMGGAHVTGTASSDFPTTPGAFDPNHNGGPDVFVAKLNPVGSALAYSTFLGGAGLEGGSGIALDGAGNVHVSGYTALSNDFPTTPGAFDLSYNGGTDVFVVKLNRAGSDLVYSTFMGTSDDESGSDIAVDGVGNTYVTGSTGSSDFPTTIGAFDPSYNGGDSDAFVSKLRLEPYIPDVLAPIEQPPAGAYVSGAVTLRGYAIDRASATGTGIDLVHIYLDGPYGTGTIIGGATYGLDRPDIAAQYGTRFAPSGWELAWDTTGLAPGVHRLYLYAHRTTDNAWSLMEPHLVIVPGGPARWLPIVLRQQ
jgi:hypothetical protein